MQREKILDVAEEVRLATFKANEQNIIYNQYSDAFIVTSNTFQDLKGSRDYTVEHFKYGDESQKYKYRMTIAGLTFITLSPFLIYEGDSEKLREAI
ncbi:MAG: hypothetical protein GX957_10630 [Clostridiaceae bacterium]|nr:hypothetical protein [Clostridiaceae bacterium]